MNPRSAIGSLLSQAITANNDLFTVSDLTSTELMLIDGAKQGWVGFDLDGTLAISSKTNDIGAPVPRMVERLKFLIKHKVSVRVLTARANDRNPQHDNFILTWDEWSVKHLGHRVTATCKKDHLMALLFDDRAVSIKRDTGLTWDEFYRQNPINNHPGSVTDLPLGTKCETPSAKIKRSALEILRDATALYEQRNSIYGDNYHNFGKLMSGLYPHGLSIDGNDIEGFNRLGIIVQIASKLGRYCQNPEGHPDSAEDQVVYAAMLTELTPDPHAKAD